MSTRALLARVEGDDLLGVVHLYDSHPWVLGNLLLLELLDRAGDLQGALDAWITRAPGEWSWLPERKHQQDTERLFWRRADMTEVGFFDYVYLFDLAKRTLRVWEGNPAEENEDEEKGRWDAPDWTLTIAANGRANPPVFSTPAPPWPDIPIASGAEGDSREAAEQREAFVLAIREHADDEPAFACCVRDVLVEQISKLEWEDSEPSQSEPERALRERLKLPREPLGRERDDSLRVTFYLSEENRYWELSLGPYSLRFPSPASIGRTLTDELELWLDGRTASLALESLPSNWYGVLVKCAAQACWPERAWSYDDGTLYALVEVVPDEAVRDPHRQIALSEAREIDPQCTVDDELGMSHRDPPVHWLVLEWLRLHALRGWTAADGAH
ncbi:NusA N-terminal domain-containing protein [Polyangium aurulentum]|uniref:NusA N-terminal domain-containing protein n=1 Tax=Polyangium aurulentum TaxID=2567896 RepID=UPI0010ADE72B|nr:NusA N-terminal domain-containing protein [Polyangium aurulentum]UQA60605.1 hypothetical protein E8A73_009075 [Polyangium aurulentum]